MLSEVGDITDKIIISSHMFSREKYDANGNFEKLNARLVADGRGKDSTDFDESELASSTAILGYSTVLRLL